MRTGRSGWSRGAIVGALLVVAGCASASDDVAETSRSVARGTSAQAASAQETAASLEVDFRPGSISIAQHHERLARLPESQDLRTALFLTRIQQSLVTREIFRRCWPRHF